MNYRITTLLVCVFCFAGLQAAAIDLREEDPYLAHRLRDAEKRFEKTMYQYKKKGHLSSRAFKEVNKGFLEAQGSINPQEFFFGFIDQLKKARIIYGTSAYHVKNSWIYTAGYVFDEEMVSHDGVSWSAAYSNQPQEEKKRRRASIFEQTKTAVRNGYLDGNGFYFQIESEVIDAMQVGTYISSNPPQIPSEKIGKYETTVSVLNKDTFDAAFDLKHAGLNPVALNMAAATHSGGGAIFGAAAQEESLFRRSTYWLGLDPRYNKHLSTQLQSGNYSIPEFGAVYTPGVAVVRDTIDNGFLFREPFTIDMIASAAYNLKYFPNGSDYRYVDGTVKKIRAILRMAVETKHDSIVLGAFGAGAFGGDAEEVATLFKRVLLEDEFHGVFRRIIFAVIDDHNGLNYRPFYEILNR